MGAYYPKKKKGKYVGLKRKNSKLQKAIKIGDIIQVGQYNKKKKKYVWGHAMIVTGGKKGDWRVSYHSSPYSNGLLRDTAFVNKSAYRVIRIR